MGVIGGERGARGGCSGEEGAGCTGLCGERWVRGGLRGAQRAGEGVGRERGALGQNGVHVGGWCGSQRAARLAVEDRC